MSAGLDKLINTQNYKDKRRVKNDAAKVLDSATYRPLLSPMMGPFLHNNGLQSMQLILHGTLPITYNGSKFYLPMQMYIFEGYPAEPPRIYLRPTSDMYVKPNHQYVDMQGQVYLPYLHEWNPSSSNLMELLELAGAVFSIDPPLHAKPKNVPSAAIAQQLHLQRQQQQGQGHIQYGQTAAASASTAAVASPQQQWKPVTSNTNNPFPSTEWPPRQPGQTTYASPASSSSSSSSANGSHSQPAVATATAYWAGAASSSSGVSTPVMGTVASATPLAAVTAASIVGGASSFGVQERAQQQQSAQEKAQHEKLVDEVTMKLLMNFQLQHQQLRDELDREMNVTLKLGESKAKAEENMRDLQALEIELQAGLDTLQEKHAALDAWEAEESAKPVIRPIDRLEPFDEVSSQIIDLTAKNLAVDDAMYYLERSLQCADNKEVDHNVFLKQCQKLSRSQFLYKAHLMKINAILVQQELQLARESQPQQQYEQQQQQSGHRQHQQSTQPQQNQQQSQSSHQALSPYPPQQQQQQNWSSTSVINSMPQVPTGAINRPQVQQQYSSNNPAAPRPAYG